MTVTAFNFLKTVFTWIGVSFFIGAFSFILANYFWVVDWHGWITHFFTLGLGFGLGRAVKNTLYHDNN